MIIFRFTPGPSQQHFQMKIMELAKFIQDSLLVKCRNDNHSPGRLYEIMTKTLFRIIFIQNLFTHIHIYY